MASAVLKEAVFENIRIENMLSIVHPLFYNYPHSGTFAQGLRNLPTCFLNNRCFIGRLQKIVILHTIGKHRSLQSISNEGFGKKDYK